MKKNILLILGLFPLLAFLPGCDKDKGIDVYTNYYNWLPSEFPQGEPMKNAEQESAQIQSAKVYNQFATLAMFDVISVDEKLLRGIADLKAERQGLAKHERDMYLLRSLEDLGHSYVFYVLADIRDNDHANLTDPLATWAVTMKMDGMVMKPDTVKEVEFDAEVRHIFGAAAEHMGFKTGYIVSFNKDEGADEASQTRTIIFSSPQKKVELNF